MRIDRLRLDNFRCFASTEIEFDARLNVLVGDNATGKTAILEGLAVAAASWFLGLPEYGARHIQPNDVRLSARKRGDDVSFVEQYPVKVTASGIVQENPIEWSRGLSGPGRRTNYADAVNIRDLAATAGRAIAGGLPVTLPVIAYYGSGRLWLPLKDMTRRRAYTKKELSPLEGYRYGIDQRISQHELSRWLERQDRIAYQSGEEGIVYRTVSDAMRRMANHATDVRFDNSLLEIVVQYGDREPKPFRLLSDGQRNMIALAGDLAMRSARLNGHLGASILEKSPGIVLIDEVDLHLHPAWQRHIIGDLMSVFPSFQFFVTTHSAQIIGEVEPECVLLLDRTGDDIVVQNGAQTFGLDSNWILRHVMKAQSRDLEIQNLIDSIEDDIEDDRLDHARRSLETLRTRIHGEDGDVVRLEASINMLEDLAE